jgi:DNA-binding IclR family transcriptional regulator
MNVHAAVPEMALVTVDRGMQVLRAFRCDRTGLSNAELVRRTGLSKATVSRLTSTLLQLGFLRHVTGGREFELGTGAFAIGHAFVDRDPLLQAANPHLQRLADALDVSVALAAGDRLEMLYVGYKAGRGVGTLRMRVGSVLSMGTTAIGHAYLWGLPVAERQRRLDALKVQAGEQEIAVENSMRRSFAELESTGTCGVLGGHRPGTFGIALPVVVGRDRVVMGLSCGKAEARPDLASERRRIAPALKEAARELEEALAQIAA